MRKISSTAHVRTFTTSYRHFPVKATEGNRYSGMRCVPWIRLGGVWLERAGFKVGQALKVEVRNKVVVISSE
ncbi:type I addiction module toxin, SymE family [Cupriavidus necator]|uniref:Type I addiction module toxin, SymE family n=1 Tax=Cupriavidus necator TaxID=106590 RepID=A0A2P1DUZ3_CUPNE|nr:type I addiction module toxin, SymE family [Cupriavidus necator]